MTTSLEDEIVGVVGIGNIGAPMTRSLIRAGLHVWIYGRRKEVVDGLVAEGATAASSLSELASKAHAVCIIVVDDAQVREVVGQLIREMAPGSYILIHSTIIPSTAAELAVTAAERQITVLDCAVSGGAEKAELGTLALMIGGDAAAVEHCQPIFHALGKHQFHVGPVGNGEVAKLVNNLVAVGSYALQVEAMELGEAYGLDEDTCASVIIASQGDSRGMHMWGRNDRHRAAREKGSPHRVERDLEEAAKAAGLKNVLMPLTTAASEMLPHKLRKRDEKLASRPPGPPIPRCSGCHSELAPPFRAAGIHPECREDPTS